jgi:hypothetical protein
MVLLSVWGLPGRGEGGQLVDEFFSAADDTVFWRGDLPTAFGSYNDLDERLEYVRPPHMDHAPAAEGQHVDIRVSCRDLILQNEIPHDAGTRHVCLFLHQQRL